MATKRTFKSAGYLRIFLVATASVLTYAKCLSADTGYVVLPYLSHLNAESVRNYSDEYYQSLRKLVVGTFVQCRNWHPVREEYSQRIGRAFRSILIRGHDSEQPVPNLPYSALELCREDSLTVLAVFYVYNDDDHVIGSIVGGAMQLPGASSYDISDEEIYYYLSVYQVEGNRILFELREEIDDLLEMRQSKTPATAAEAFLQAADNRIQDWGIRKDERTGYQAKREADKTAGKVMLFVGIGAAVTAFLIVPMTALLGSRSY